MQSRLVPEVIPKLVRDAVKHRNSLCLRPAALVSGLLPVVVALFPVICASAVAQPVPIYENDFESSTVQQAPPEWRPFHKNSQPSVTVVQDGFLSSQCLRGERSDSGGWTALSHEFQTPQQRVMIEFSFAFSETKGRSLNIWTHEPNGTDASQFNICIQNGILMQFDGRTRSWETITANLTPTPKGRKPVWHRLQAVMDADQQGIDFRVSKPGTQQLSDHPVTRSVYRTGLPIAAIDFVSGHRIAEDAWYLTDNLVITGGDDLPAPGKVEPLPEKHKLWTGEPIPDNPEDIPFAQGVRHQTIHQATRDGYKFLHGAAIVHHQRVMYSNWANSPVHENGPHETLQGRRSADGGKTWSDVEIIGPGFDGPERHSHGVLFVHNDQVWTIAARFGTGTPGRRFPGLKGEAFVLDSQSGQWQSKGVVMHNCWPYDEPVRMANGNFITGGQDKDGLPVVALSHGADFTRWDSVLIPYSRQLKPSFAETTVWAEGRNVTAVIRGGGGTAWVAESEDCGETWSTAAPSNLPMPRAKAYLGKLSTGQRYLLSNLKNRDTLVISVSRPGAATFGRMYRIRHGRSGPPRFDGRAKNKQWSYPYGYEHDGKLFVVYSIGKEDCGLSTIPIQSLQVEPVP